jgi:hypothetical protein
LISCSIAPKTFSPGKGYCNLTSLIERWHFSQLLTAAAQIGLGGSQQHLAEHLVFTLARHP